MTTDLEVQVLALHLALPTVYFDRLGVPPLAAR